MHDCYCISPPFVFDGLQETVVPGGTQESVVPGGIQESVVPGGIQESGVPGGIQEFVSRRLHLDDLDGPKESFALKESPQKATKGAFVRGGIVRTEHVGPLDFRSIRISK